LSVTSKKFVVATNPSQQYENCMHHLFHSELELDKVVDKKPKSVPWSLYANTISWYILLATKQSQRPPGKYECCLERGLSPQDLAYVHHKFFKDLHQITIGASESFWKPWFSAVLKELKTEMVVSLWTNGYFWGFVPREELNTILFPAPRGTFLLRFCSTTGQVGIGYKKGDNSIGNYIPKLQQAGDQNRNLAFFLATHSVLSNILKNTGATPNGEPCLKTVLNNLVGNQKRIRRAPTNEHYEPDIAE